MVRRTNPEIIQLLNKEQFTHEDMTRLLKILLDNPNAGSYIGNHNRSTIWVCCQHSDCYYRRAVLPPLLVMHGANVDHKAGNGYTPLLSLYNAWETKYKNNPQRREHKRQMANVLVHTCGATIPYNNTRARSIDIPGWIRNSPINIELLE